MPEMTSAKSGFDRSKYTDRRVIPTIPDGGPLPESVRPYIETYQNRDAAFIDALDQLEAAHQELDRAREMDIAANDAAMDKEEDAGRPDSDLPGIPHTKDAQGQITEREVKVESRLRRVNRASTDVTRALAGAALDTRAVAIAINEEAERESLTKITELQQLLAAKVGALSLLSQNDRHYVKRLIPTPTIVESVRPPGSPAGTPSPRSSGSDLTDIMNRSAGDALAELNGLSQMFENAAARLSARPMSTDPEVRDALAAAVVTTTDLTPDEPPAARGRTKAGTRAS